jgi:uncharacterized membrane protein (DUF106 family)
MITVQALLFTAIIGNFILTILLYYYSQKNAIDTWDNIMNMTQKHQKEMAKKLNISTEGLRTIQNRVMDIQNTFDSICSMAKKKEEDGK